MEAPASGQEEESPPIELHELRTHLNELADAGADEAILVLDPINERSVAAVAEALALAPHPAQSRPRSR